LILFVIHYIHVLSSFEEDAKLIAKSVPKQKNDCLAEFD